MNPFIPMLALTGKPTEQQIEKMLKTYKSVGIDAVLLYPRSGLEIEYMSEEFRALIEFAIQTAERLSMYIWLYDEFNWPSGSCKNMVIKEDPAFAARRFVYENGTVRVETMEPGKAERVFHPFDNDVLNPAAVDCFIRLTHEKYYQWFGKYFGNVIPGIFTDEPSFIYTANAEGLYPYYDGIEQDYEAACGSDLKADIVAFHQGADTPHFPGVFRSLVGERFKESFITRIADWCNAHGLLLAGHTLNDEAPLLATFETGEWFSFIEKLTVPGVDEIPSKLYVNTDVLFTMLENIRYNGSDYAMAELFALGPCSMPFARRKQILWYAAAHGINRYFIAISHLDAKGNVKKPDFFDNVNYHCPDFEGFGLLAQEAAKSAAFAAKTVDAAIGVYCPYTAYLAALGHRQGQPVNDLFKATIDALIAHQIPWRMLREGEQHNCQMALYPSLEGVKDTVSGTVYVSPEEAAKAATPFRKATVTDETGALLQDVLVKTYTDGTIAVIDRRNEALGARRATLTTANGTADILLDNYGVCVFENGELIEAAPEGNTYPVEGATLSFPYDNTYRLPFFVTDTQTVTLTEPMTVTAFLHTYPETPTLTVDGKVITLSEPCDQLTGCYSHLYVCGKLDLAAGEHTFTMDAKDYGYLPALLLMGDFMAEGNTLRPRGNETAGAFWNTATVTATVDLTDKAVAIETDDIAMYTTASLNGELIGAAAFPPYRFPVPEKFRGQTVTLTLNVHTTLAPLFNDLKALKRANIFVTPWNDVPASTPETIDLSTLNIRVKEN